MPQITLAGGLVREGEGLPGYLLGVNPSPLSLSGVLLDGLLVVVVGLVLAVAVVAVAIADSVRGRP